MALSYGLGIYGEDEGVVTPLDDRLWNVGVWAKTATANLIRAGLLYNGSSTIVTGTSGMSYSVAPFAAVSTRGATQGAVPFANDATETVPTAPAPGSNSRYDVVYAWPRDYALDGVNSDPVLGVIQGTAAASPSVPSLSAYPGAIELARILVPAGVTATNSGTTITQTAPFTAAAGGVVPVRNTTERDAGSWLPGQHVWLLDTGRVQVYTGSAWRVAYTVSPVSFTPSIALVTVGNGTLSGEYEVSAGRHVTGYARFVLGSTSAVSGSPTLTLPVGSIPNVARKHGDAILRDTGTATYGGALLGSGTSAVRIDLANAAGTYLAFTESTTSTVPFTWTTNDVIEFYFDYWSTTDIV